MMGSQLGTGMARRVPKGTPVGSRLKLLCNANRAPPRCPPWTVRGGIGALVTKSTAKSDLTQTPPAKPRTADAIER
jgi:hypothetical protein